jgi:hypothetical protein
MQRWTGARSPRTSRTAFPERLGAIEHAEHPLGGVKAALDQIRQQGRGDGGVLGRSLPEPERDLHAVAGDAQRDDVGAPLQVDAVEHQDRQAHVGKAPGHQLRERLVGALDEGARDRRLADPSGDLLDLLAYRLAGAAVAPARDAGQHPLHDGPRERVAIGEVGRCTHPSTHVCREQGGAVDLAADDDVHVAVRRGREVPHIGRAERAGKHDPASHQRGPGAPPLAARPPVGCPGRCQRRPSAALRISR